MILSDLPFNEETKFLHEYYTVFIVPKSKEVHSLECLAKNVKGYLLLNVDKCGRKRRLTKIIYEGAQH